MINKTMLGMGILVELGTTVFYREIVDSTLSAGFHGAVTVALFWVWMCTKSPKQLFNDMEEMRKKDVL